MIIQILGSDPSIQLKYYDLDNFDDLQVKEWRQIYGVCFYMNQMVVVLNGKKGTWGLVGGSPEINENFEQALKREVQEESNMKILKWLPIGTQEVHHSDGQIYNQLRAVCLVEPHGKFEADPAGTITKIKLIDPKDYKQYFDWGEIGERIITRALTLKNELNKF